MTARNTVLETHVQSVRAIGSASVTVRWPPARRRRLVLVAGALVLLHLLVLAPQLSPLRAVWGLPITVLLPGALALRIIGGRRRRAWDQLLHTLALSLLGLSVVGVALALLPGGGLTTLGSLAGFDVLVAILLAGVMLADRVRGRRETTPPAIPARVIPASGYRAGQLRPDLYPSSQGQSALYRSTAHRPRFRWARTDRPPAGRSGWSWAGRSGVDLATVVPGRLGWAGIVLGAAAVGLAVVGARQLNAGGGPAVTMLAFALVAAALATATAAAGRRQGTAAATTIYLVSLAVLLATSLRGAGVTGHDIKIEYRVFTDTLSSGSWRPGGEFPGYNSCLSITVLPTFFARLLGLAALDVFRVCFQVLFAVVPVGVYLGARRLLPPPYAVLAAGLVLAFPTFVNDLPMLNRQEIGLIFFVVLVLNLMEKGRPGPQQWAMLVAAAAGLTASHYTSMDVAAQLLLLAWLLRTALRRVRWLPAPRVSLRPLGSPTAMMLVMAVGWPVVAGSAPAFVSTLKSSFASITEGGSVAATSTSYSFFSSAPAQTDTEVLDGYLSRIRAARGLNEEAAARCVPEVLPADELAPTRLGAALDAAGVSPHGLNAALRSAAVLLFQGGALAGVALLWWRVRRRARPTARVLAEFGTAGIALLAVTVAVPQLSDAYGLLRLFQQLLLVLAPAVVLVLATGVRMIARRLAPGRGRAAAKAVTALVVIGCGLATTGFVPRLTGGYVPQLNLADAGPYFRAYYASAGDLGAVSWLGTHLPAGTPVVADSRDAVNLLSLTTTAPAEGLAPGTAPADAHLLLRTDDDRRASAVAVVGEQILRYTFPLTCMTIGRPLVHASGVHRLYGPVAPR